MEGVGDCGGLLGCACVVGVVVGGGGVGFACWGGLGGTGGGCVAWYTNFWRCCRAGMSGTDCGAAGAGGNGCIGGGGGVIERHGWYINCGCTSGGWYCL